MSITMAICLPNPFCALAPAKVAQTAAAPNLSDPSVAAADNFPRGFDPLRFLRDIDCGSDPMPQFISSPSREFLLGCGLGPVLEILERS
jgi:hypothetical protein